jgi:hypothetical protein
MRFAHRVTMLPIPGPRMRYVTVTQVHITGFPEPEKRVAVSVHCDVTSDNMAGRPFHAHAGDMAGRDEGRDCD